MLDISRFREFQVDPDVAREQRLVTLNPNDPQNRPYNLLRRRLGLALGERKTHIVGITSATPKAGKSSLTLNLAVSLARLQDGPVMVVDLDLRRGTTGQLLALPFETGVTGYFADPPSDLNDIGWRITNAGNLSVIPSKTLTTDSGSLLSGPRLAELIEELRTLHDAIVLVDLPPVLANDDAMTIVNQCDGYLFVVAAGTNTQKQIDTCMEMLRPAHCLGVVLNRYRQGLVDNSGYDYDGYGYAEYFSAGEHTPSS